MPRVVRLAVSLGVLLAAAATASCGSGTTPITPTTPAAVLATEVFTGVIVPLGTASHSFTVTYATAYSDASLTVTSLATVADGTAAPVTIGVAFGTTSLGVCTRSTTYVNPAGPYNVELPTTGAPFIAGTFCVQLFDNPAAPTVTEPLNYSITVKHY